MCQPISAAVRKRNKWPILVPEATSQQLEECNKDLLVAPGTLESGGMGTACLLYTLPTKPGDQQLPPLSGDLGEGLPASGVTTVSETGLGSPGPYLLIAVTRKV